ncbi:hypothetical protein I546_0633 [Mycobacterium kansasii 732]|nr:hypothetical protein I546_0633 [Mycobacterium kansasii 732]
MVSMSRTAIRSAAARRMFVGRYPSVFSLISSDSGDGHRGLSGPDGQRAV